MPIAPQAAGSHHAGEFYEASDCIPDIRDEFDEGKIMIRFRKYVTPAALTASLWIVGCQVAAESPASFPPTTKPWHVAESDKRNDQQPLSWTHVNQTNEALSESASTSRPAMVPILSWSLAKKISVGLSAGQWVHLCHLEGVELPERDGNDFVFYTSNGSQMWQIAARVDRNGRIGELSGIPQPPLKY